MSNSKVDKTAKMNRQLLVALKRSKEKEKSLEKQKSSIEAELVQLASQLKSSQETLLLLQGEMQSLSEKTEALENEEIEEDEKKLDELENQPKATPYQDSTSVKAISLFLSFAGLAGLGLWVWKRS